MNPLLRPSPLKNSAFPFRDLKPEHFLPALEQAIEAGRGRLEAVKTKTATFDHTIRALEDSTEELEFVFTIFGNLLAADTNENLQALSLEMGPRVASFANDILLDPVIFAKVREVHESRLNSGLGPEQIHLVEKIYRDFERSGAGLGEREKTRLRAIDERLSQLHPKFRDNVLKATNAFELWITSESDLEGLPPTLRTAAREAAKEKGRPEAWLITLQHPSYLPFLQFAKVRPLRERVWRAQLARCLSAPCDNQPLVLEMVALMEEKARILGHSSYAEYALQLRMAETPAQVYEFLNKLVVATKPAAIKELGELREMASRTGGSSEIMPWDIWYYAERLKEEKYAFDQEQLRPYFMLDNVLKGVFEHARRLFNLEFQPTREYPAYHDEVQVFEVYKANAERTFVGLFYADFFPRASKGQGAWMTNYREQGTFRGQRVRPHVSIVCNFTKPTAELPSLLTFDEVTTLFHEFGHALHSLLSQVEFRSLAGTNVYLDFCELPSQILENWAEEEESLKLFAFHYKTGETIPMDLVERLKKSQKFLVGINAMRQLNFAFLDMAWFTKPPADGETVPRFEERVTEVTRIQPAVPGSCISTSFNHIFGGGYASGYYSYKWAEALDADAFEMFKEKGVFDRDTAARFEEFILSKGGSDHPMQLYEQFRGRSPDPDALLRRDGLLNP